jgi:hypothetical protein
MCLVRVFRIMVDASLDQTNLKSFDGWHNRRYLTLRYSIRDLPHMSWKHVGCVNGTTCFVRCHSLIQTWQPMNPHDVRDIASNYLDLGTV